MYSYIIGNEEYKKAKGVKKKLSRKKSSIETI